MALKAIEFEYLKDICKYRGESTECTEENCYSGECEEGECPVWSELLNSEVEK